jgi:hypothetical protein
MFASFGSLNLKMGFKKGKLGAAIQEQKGCQTSFVHVF